MACAGARSKQKAVSFRRGVASLSLLGLLCSSCIYMRMFYYNTPSLDAPTYFESRTVRASTGSTPMKKRAVEAKPPMTDDERAKYGAFDALLEKNDTRAFIAIRDDEIVYERYFGDVTAKTPLPGFSISKTFAALLVGCAVDDGLVSSLDDSVVAYIPELSKKTGYDAVTLDEMLRMTSGIDFDEESPSSAKLYYCTDLRQRIYQYPVKWTPGQHYLYGSVSIQLLWDVLHRRLGERTVSQYFEKRVWQPLGAEHAAAWSLDSEESGVEKLFGGFNATARDHARLGLLYLHGGTLDGHTIVSQSWIDASLTADPVAGVVHITDGDVKRGKYQWFHTLDGRAYFAKGYRGQYVFVVPDRHMVFVRFGVGYGDVGWPALFLRMADAG